MDYEYIGLGYHSEVGGASAVYQNLRDKEDPTITSAATHRSAKIPVAANSKTGGGFVRPVNPEEQTCNRSPPPPPPPPPPPAPPTADTDYGKQQPQQQQEQQQHPQSPLRKLPPTQLNPQKLSVIHQRREQLAQQNTAAQDDGDDEAREKIATAAAAAAAAADTTTTAATGSDNEMIEAARLRAMEVISKFQQQQEECNLGDGELGRKRKEFFDTFQKEKLRLAMIKNLEYVARVEDERLQAKLVLQEQAHHYHIQLEDYHNQVLLSRQQQQQQQQQQQEENLNTSQAGIGTQQRSTQEKKKRKQQQHIPNNQESVAIYVSNLPTDGSASDELMRALFGSYGSLRKIHFYYDKQTGNLKGDALVIYNLDSNNNTNNSSDDGGGGNQNRDSKSELIDTVCCQMNGAELPCGTALKVEPSDPLYAIRKKRQQAIQYGQVPADAMETIEAEMKKPAIKSGDDRRHGQNKEGTSQSHGENEPVASNDNDDDDDLDDFFASL